MEGWIISRWKVEPSFRAESRGAGVNEQGRQTDTGSLTPSRQLPISLTRY